jgi:hypothetical protein
MIECENRRVTLIDIGTIKPVGSNSPNTTKDKRERLISMGIITPIPHSQFIPEEKNDYTPSNIGVYVSTPIQSESEYERRKNNYFWMICDIIQTRRELGLNLDSKSEVDPDWYF